ncbi:hypothetical protein AB0N14_17625 [Streptomyces sp. NPDC051104]|uniref:hypothetical protein n=1 Tax=Streptomyces sp. NPDC051104 TaxID=3155044 RepID=UPI0034251B53
MEAQHWRNLGVEGRPPTPALVFVAAVLAVLVHHQYGARTALTVALALVALDCIRIRRKGATIPHMSELEINGTNLTKRLQRERHNN